MRLLLFVFFIGASALLSQTQTVHRRALPVSPTDPGFTQPASSGQMPNIGQISHQVTVVVPTATGDVDFGQFGTGIRLRASFDKVAYFDIIAPIKKATYDGSVATGTAIASGAYPFLFISAGYSPLPAVVYYTGSRETIISEPTFSITGQPPRTVTSKLQDSISVKDYGAVGNGITDDRAAIQAAIDATPTGGTLTIPNSANGYLLLTPGPSGAALNITKSIHLRCEGKLIVGSLITASTDVILVRGTGTLTNGSITGCELIPYNGGGIFAPARWGIHFDATSATNGEHAISGWRIEGNSIGPFQSNAIRVSFPNQANGFSNSQITKNRLYNGIECNRCGDMIEIASNRFIGTVPGPAPAIYLSQVFGTGQTYIHHNTFQTCAPAIRVVQGSGVRIDSNNLQMVLDAGCSLQFGAVMIEGTAPDTWVTDVNGSTSTADGAAVGNSVTNNTFLPSTAFTHMYHVTVGDYAKGTRITGNRFGLSGFYSATERQRGINVAAAAKDTFISENSIDYTNDWTLLLTNQAGANTQYLPATGTSSTFANLSCSGDRKMLFCSNCTPATSPCTGSGTGAWVFTTGTQCNCPF